MVGHSALSGPDRGPPSLSGGGADGGLEQFPAHNDAVPWSTRSAGPREGPGYSNLDPSSARWLTRRDHGHSNGFPGRGHGRQKSLSDAIRNIRNRSGSVSQNVHEITDALKAPVSPKLIVCFTPALRGSGLLVG